MSAPAEAPVLDLSAYGGDLGRCAAAMRYLIACRLELLGRADDLPHPVRAGRVAAAGRRPVRNVA